MKKRLLSILLTLALLAALTPLSAGAASFYLIEDSDARYLSYDELWDWSYDALGYILNELFARYGMPFKAGGIYQRYFSRQAWYKEYQGFSYDRIHNDYVWKNEQTIKQVRADMRALGTRNEGGKGVPDIEPPLTFANFTEATFTRGKNYPVYSGPGSGYYRGANGKASVSTNGSIWVAGRENGYLLVMYWLDSGAARIGYIDESRLDGYISTIYLAFAYEQAQVTTACQITDDPVARRGSVASLPAGDRVTFLQYMSNDQGQWAYVEANTAAGLVRGFVPYACVTME